MAVALRAGAVLRDLEFVQFHPTVMYLGPDSRGQQPLISEAVRGEGAFLVDFEGNRFMQGVHELADLAPRDVVAKAIMRRMLETGHPHMWLDARHLGAEFWERRFPTILATCRSHGVDPVTDLIPVAPACHYASGGVRTDLWGRTQRARPLRHRRGRLLRRARRQPARLQLAARGPGLLPPDRRRAAGRAAPAAAPRRPTAVRRAWSPGDLRRELQEVMTSRVGVLRIAAGLAEATDRLDKLAGRAADARRPGVVGDHQPAHHQHRAVPTPPRCARRPAARTGARTSPSATTSTSPATSTRHGRRLLELAFGPAPQTDPSLVAAP